MKLLDASTLHSAAMGVLEPLMRALPGEDVSAALADAIDRCAATARENGVRSVGYLSAIVVPFLRRQVIPTNVEPGRELVEVWVNDLLAFCTGQMPGPRVRSLVDQLGTWPKLSQLPPEFVEMIVERLQHDARSIERFNDGADVEPLSSPILGASRIESTGSRRDPAPIVELAVDELELLAEESLAFEERVHPSLLGGTNFSGGPVVAGDSRDFLEDYAGELEHLGNALEFIGLTGLQRALLRTSAAIREQAPRGEELADQLHRRLVELPVALKTFFTQPDQVHGKELAIVMQHWLGEADARALELGLSRIRVIISRQVLPRETRAATADLSIAVPGDADRAVVEQLKREMPKLCEEFAQCIEQVREGRADKLADAQRVAHTLKGAANTVGVRGIATLTHQLEDLLQLLQTSAQAAPAGLIDLLARAADSLSEMNEALLGISVAPTDIAQLHQELVEWINRLARQAGASVDFSTEEGAPELDSELDTNLDSHVDSHPASNRASNIADEHRVDPPAAEGQAGDAQRSDAQRPDAQRPDAHIPDAQAFGPPVLDAVVEGAPTLVATSQASPGVPPVAPIGVTPAVVVAPAVIVAPGDELADAAAEMANPGLSAVTAAEDGPQMLQIPASLMERMLETIAQASIKLAQMQEHIGQIDSTRHTLRSANDGLQSLSGELERLVDVRGVALTGRTGKDEFDSLELDEYNDLHTLSRRILEAGADHRIIDRNFDHHLLELKELSDQVERLQVDMRELVHSTRLVPVHSLVPRLNRAVRQAARMAGKSVELQVEGAQTEIDGEMLQSLVDSLTQLLRNAVDHGIESSAQRIMAGKPSSGKIVLKFNRDASAITIDCSDDGAGIDLFSVRKRAEAMNYFADGAEFDPTLNPINDQQLMRLIFRPGFSTRRSVTQLSGRGIGLDVVNQAVHKLRGQIEVHSTPGAGASFSITIAAKAASQPVMVIQDPRYCLALLAHDIEEILAARSLAVNDEGAQIAYSSQGPIGVLALSDLLGLPSRVFASEPGDCMVLVVHTGDGNRIGIVSPPLSQARNVLVRALPAWVPSGPGVTGLAVLGDGSIAPVLDLPALLAMPADTVRGAAGDLTFEDTSLPICLVVDDSVSVRRSMELFLNDIGLRVITAADGVQAMDRIRRYKPALVIADLEMPRMNGIELAKAMRADAQFAEIPIIMITSRFSQKHRMRALEAGVTVFLTKPYTEDAVASEIQRCLAQPNPV